MSEQLEEVGGRTEGDAALLAGCDEDTLPRLLGRVLLLKRLARGGMGEVYLGATGGIEGAERPCVVKTIRREHGSDRSFRARFLDETRIQAQLQHPGVAQILDSATTADGAPYAVVEYIEGRHLGEVLARSNQLGVSIAWADAVAIGISFGDALAHIHERTDAAGRPLEIAHRDLSPQNVMLGYAGDLKLIDFGTAKGENRRSRTVSGIVYAKPGYVAPEVANQVPGGAPADLYAFGVMLWELLAGHRFLQGDAVEHQAMVAEGRRPLPPISRQCGAPERLDAILTRLTAKDLEQRYASARRAVGELAELLKLAPSLADGDRSVRGRVAQLMARLYPAEPARSRADFARRVLESHQGQASKSSHSARPGVPEPSPAPPAQAEGADGILPGTRYRLRKVISRGGMGEVWEAVHLDLGRPVALKLIIEESSRSPEARQRFRAEARAVARLDHPGLVKIHDFGVSADGRCYCAMELLAGETLEQRLERGPLSWKAAVALTIEAANALSAAHAAGVVHRDITPSNLFITQQGTVKLIDFGVAGSLERPTEAAAGSPLVVGTPEYISPEQAAGAAADARSDLYSLGVVLYQALTGTVPHPLGPGGSPTLAALLTAKITVTPTRPSARSAGADLPARLDRIVLSALERDADLRPPTVQALAGQLEELLREGPRRRPRVVMALGSALVFATGLSLALGSLLWQRPLARQEVAALDPAVDIERLVEAVQKAPPLSVPDEVREPAQPELDPRADEVQAEIADALALGERGQKIRAHHRMKELSGLHPAHASVQAALVTTARGVGAWGEAIHAARRWVELEPSAQGFLALARLQRATLDPAASETLRHVLALEPEHGEARRLLEAYTQKRVAAR